MSDETDRTIAALRDTVRMWTEKIRLLEEQHAEDLRTIRALGADLNAYRFPLDHEN
jgi:hypothetical protein